MGIPIPGSITIKSAPFGMVSLNKRFMGSTDQYGTLHLRDIHPGNYNIKIVKDGYRPAYEWITVKENMDTLVEITLTELPSPGVAVFLSTIFPGGGDIYLDHSDWWIYTFGISGLVYGAIYYSKDERINELIWVKDENGRRHLEKRGKQDMILFAIGAGLLWLYDLIHVYSSANSLEGLEMYKEIHESRYGIAIIPGPDVSMIAYQWRW